MKGAIAQASQLSQILGDWGDRFYKQAAAGAEAKGKRAGLSAGLAGEYEPRTGDTIYDQAFNIGAFEAYKGTIQLDAKNKIRDYALQVEKDHPGDADIFDTLVNNYAYSTLKEQSNNPELQAFTKHKIAEYAFEYRTAILKDGMARAKQEQIEVFYSILNEDTNDLTNAIRSGDEALSGNRLLELQTHFDKGVAAGHLTGKEAATKFQKIKDDATELEYTVGFERVLESGGIDRGWVAYEQFKFNTPEETMSVDVKERIETMMETSLATFTQHQDRVDRLADLQVTRDQERMFASGLIKESIGKLTMLEIQEQLRARKINPTQFKALAKLLDADLKEVNAAINRNTEFYIWQDIHNGFDEDERSDIGLKIARAIETGALSPGVAAQMLETIGDPNFHSVTKNADYKIAIEQIRIDLGRVSGPLAMYEEGTATTVAAAMRELYVRSSNGETPLDIVDSIIARGKIKLNRDYHDQIDPGLLPLYSAFHQDGSYDIQQSRSNARQMLESKTITWEQYHVIFENQGNYWRWSTEKGASVDDVTHYLKLEAERKKRIEEEQAAGVAGRK